mgnify:CR=1 FL=1
MAKNHPEFDAEMPEWEVLRLTINDWYISYAADFRETLVSGLSRDATFSVG